MNFAKNNVIPTTEIDYYVNSLRKFPLHEIGTKLWFEIHEILLKINQQAILECSEYREELIKELLVINNKLPILVHEIFCVLIWRTQILPKLFELNSNQSATTFLLYSVCFHEANAISLLEIVLYHENGCQSLGESSLDLIDYCIQSITQLIGLVHMGHYQQEEKTPEELIANETITMEFERQKRDLLYKIGMRCLSILNYLIDKLSVLPLSAATRLLQIHDTPCILSEILHCRPWLRRRSPPTSQQNTSTTTTNNNNIFEKFIDEKWTPIKDTTILKVTKIEAQTWFCLRQILLNSNIFEKYEINDYRQRTLSKLEHLLNDNILDQLTPLIELKTFLCTLQFQCNKNKENNKQNFYKTAMILEEIPMIKEEILKNTKKFGYKKIIEMHKSLFFDLKPNDIIKMAKYLNSTYTTDLFIADDDDDDDCVSRHNSNSTQTIDNEKNQCSNTTIINEMNCGNCKKYANKKCSKCLKIYYCSRECQIKHWSTEHKLNCSK